MREHPGNKHHVQRGELPDILEVPGLHRLAAYAGASFREYPPVHFLGLHVILPVAAPIRDRGQAHAQAEVVLDLHNGDTTAGNWRRLPLDGAPSQVLQQMPGVRGDLRE
jgi:hypothetical protein